MTRGFPECGDLLFTTEAPRLAEKEGRPALQVLKALLVPAADMLRFHVSGSEALKGDLPFEEGLRPNVAPQDPQLFVGHVEELRGMPGVDGRVQGEVVLSVLLEDEALRARADLDPTAYGEAIEAHRCTRLVSLKGILRRGIKVHPMDAVTDFRRMED